MVVLTREQIEERLVALHRASLELVSDLSLETLLERIVSLAREQVGAKYAALAVLDDEGSFEQFIPVGMNSEEISRMAHPPTGQGLLSIAKRGARTVRISSIQKDPRSVGFPDHHPIMKSFLGVPIILGDFLLGQIYLTDKENYPEFTEDDERVIETLAAYAAVAISNARLYRDLIDQDRALAQRNEDLALLNDVAAALASSLEVDEIIDRTLNRVMSYLKVEAGEIFLMEEGGQELRMAIHRGDSARAFWTKDSFRLGEGVVGTVAATGKQFISTKLHKEALFLRPAVVKEGFTCLVSIPLMARGNVIGVMNVATRGSRSLDKRELNLLTAIATWAGTTIENARLHRQARRLAVLEERDRIGMDLHDGIIQSIYAVGLALDYARLAIKENPDQACYKIEQAIEGLNSTIGDIRSYISDLRPRQLGGRNLLEGLQRLVDEYQKNTMAEAFISAPQDGLAVLPTHHATALFHIAQEALANVAKHAHAGRTNVHLWTTNERVLLEVADDGKGFDVESTAMTLGHGLSNMRSRAHKVGGDVEISSEPGAGTTVLAWVPLHE
jgi:two-component system, NarL family, sensor histidine kinase DevS